MANEDEKPPTSETPEEEKPTPTPPETPASEVQETAQENHEKIPQWGQALTQAVEALTETIKGVLEAPGSVEPPQDEKPTKGPWHKRGLG